MSLVWCMIILEGSVTEKYFEIVELDKNNKPLKIQSFDYGIAKEMISPVSMYSNEKAGTNNVPPIIFSEFNEQPSDIVDLESQGWEMFDEGNKYF